MKQAPGPKGNFLFGSIQEFQRDNIQFFQKLVRDYGDISYFRLGNHKIFLINDPREVYRILQESETKFKKTVFYEKFKAFVGEGLVTSEGDFWRRQRRLSQPAFHPARMRNYSGLFMDLTDAAIAEWQMAPRGRNLSADMMSLTLKIILKALLDTEVDVDYAKMADALTVLLDHQHGKVRQLIDIPEYIPTPQNLRFRKALAVVNNFVNQIIADRRASGKMGEDLLSKLLQARDDDSNAQMTDKQLRDELVTFIFAGHETSASVLGWLFYLLAKHPEAEKKIYSEVETKLGKRRPTYEELDGLVYTRAVIQETLRLYPAAWLIARSPKQDEVIGGYSVPKNSLLFLCSYVTHRHQDYWQDPEMFQPERFLSLKESEPTLKYAYFPFATGPRLCIGKHFALLEMQLIVIRIVQSLRFASDPSRPVEVCPSVTLRTKDGIWGDWQSLPS